MSYVPAAVVRVGSANRNLIIISLILMGYGDGVCGVEGWWSWAMGIWTVGLVGLWRGDCEVAGSGR